MACTTEPRPEERPYKRQRIYGHFDETIRILAGSDEIPFTIHKKILCDASAFFRAACKPEWMSPKDKIIKLPEDDSVVVQTMVYWIYHDKICMIDYDCDSNETRLNAGSFYLLLRLFVLADKLQLPRLKNDTIDALILLWDLRTEPITPSLVNYAYSNTQSDSVLRKLMVAFSVKDLDSVKFKVMDNDGAGGFCTDFKSEFAIRLLKVAEGSKLNWPTRNFCKKYHVHGEGSTLNCEDLKGFETTWEV